MADSVLPARTCRTLRNIYNQRRDTIPFSGLTFYYPNIDSIWQTSDHHEYNAHLCRWHNELYTTKRTHPLDVLLNDTKLKNNAVIQEHLIKEQNTQRDHHGHVIQHFSLISLLEVETETVIHMQSMQYTLISEQNP